MKKKFRIKKSSEIEKIVKKRIAWGNKNFTIYKNSVNNETNYFRFCVSVSKKYGNAIKRNKIKRRVREIIRLNSNRLIPVDFLIVCKPTSSILNYKEIENDILYLLKKNQIIIKKEEKNEKK